MIPACLLVFSLFFAVFTPQIHAGTITGQIPDRDRRPPKFTPGPSPGKSQTATGGVIANGTLTFTLSQPAIQIPTGQALAVALAVAAFLV